MKKYTLNVEGMRCGMCESHVNDIVRKNANVKLKKVDSSHAKNETVIIAEDGLDVNKIIEGIANMGYKVLGQKEEEYVKKGLFGRK